MALRRFVAKIYCNDKVIDHREGDDVDDLHSWMLAATEGKFGNLTGEVVDIQSGETIRSFKKAPSD